MASNKSADPRKRAPSLGDVAKLAGVSPQTASRVSTGSSLVAVGTERRVREAMRRLGYTPNRAARALRHGVYNAIGVVTHHLENTGESLTTAGIVESARERDLTVTVVQINETEEADLRRAWNKLAELPIDGLILVDVGTADADIISVPPQLPVVACDLSVAPYYPSANADEIQGVHDLMRHLINLGHTRIGHLGGLLGTHPATSREAAFQHALSQAGLPPGPVWNGDWTIESGYRAGSQIAAHPEVTAVFCANDEMAFGLIRALQEQGISVPGDVSIAGFDGTPLSGFATPTLTTIDQHFRGVAEQAVAQLFEQIAGNKAAKRAVLTPVSLLVRESTAPPKRP